jgi:hypothetical protein
MITSLFFPGFIFFIFGFSFAFSPLPAAGTHPTVCVLCARGGRMCFADVRLTWLTLPVLSSTAPPLAPTTVTPRFL